MVIGPARGANKVKRMIHRILIHGHALPGNYNYETNTSESKGPVIIASLYYVIMSILY
jgi:hypothetical protein